MKRKEDGEKRRRLYQKPRVEQVELLSGEVLQLGGCKHFNQVDQDNPTGYCHLPTACVDFGS